MGVFTNGVELKMRGLMTKHSTFHLRKEIWDDIKDYKDDYKRVIQLREINRIPFQHQSPQFDFRKYLVTVLKKLCADKKLSLCCLHLAIYIMDIFMDNHSIVQDKLLIVAMVCLLIAAKFEENSVSTPKIVDLNVWIGNRYKIEDYKNLEILILRFFNWYIMFPTAAHYTHYYIQSIISMNDLKQNENVRTLIFDLHDNILTYLDQVIDDVHYMQCYPPSKLAAAIIAASRTQIGLPSWTWELQNLTELSRADIEEPLSILLKKKHMHCAKCNM